MRASAAWSVDRLRRLDRALLDGDGSFRTLAPDRDRAHLPSELLDVALSPDDDGSLVEVAAEGIEAVFSAMMRAFPGNLLWDLDHLVVSVLRNARSSPTPTQTASTAFSRIATLQDLFGGHTTIRFRYVHDFVYGFDWAKWVGRAPQTRAGIGPFDSIFIEAMLTRGDELLQAIEEGDDARYPPLPPDRPRNAFGFSREPDAELALMRHLAGADLLPVRAWEADARPRWDRPYARLRNEAARQLALYGEAAS